ncbi:9854_t:CDS:1 [Funneliformis caledonium]|uniref:9854_t:CDS:1 n=1 Tax=Funneliformis caledonium TaxID=1117310 RepID=A0A9N8V837_9GLOM|nr:9854_t:CDS:1 [Funneliformis caledonium]
MKNYYQHIVTFFIEESVEKNSNTIKELKEIFQNKVKVFI